MMPMPRQESLSAYRAARRAGLKYVAEQNGAGKSGLLPVLETLPGELCAEIPLGYFEIPLKKIRGTYAAGRSSAFAGNFMPLLGEDTEFAEKWTTLYASSVTEGIREPVKAYEYLGYYYIVEGNKRVSVMNCSGAYSIFGRALRLLPPRGSGSAEHDIFFEILGDNNRAPIGHMWFSETGRITKLRELARKTGKKFPMPAEELINSSFASFRAVYHELGLAEELGEITTGDAFYQYVLVYGFPEGIGEDELSRNISNCLPALKNMAERGAKEVLGDPSELARKSVFASFLRGARLSVLFACCGTPESSLSAQAHYVGRYALERDFPAVGVNSVCGLPQGPNCYEPLMRAVREHNPDILFATSPSMRQAALRVSLEARNTLVLHCHYKQAGVLGTYSAKTEESAFLMGALAASLTETGVAGYLRPSDTLGNRTQNMQAFAQGARFIRPSTRVYFATSRDAESRREIFAQWAAMGADMACMPHEPQYGPPPAEFPGVYSRLFRLSQEGVPSDRCAVSALHWDVFYTRLAREITEGSAVLLARHDGVLHFRLGLASGVTDTHAVYPAVKPSSFMLLRHLHYLISQGQLTPINEDSPVEVIETPL